jgi:hypothetical protein
MKPAVRVCLGSLVVMALVTLNAQVKQTRQAAMPFWSDLGAGPYSVGFRVLYYRDHRRKWGKRQPEPSLIWDTPFGWAYGIRLLPPHRPNR